MRGGVQPPTCQALGVGMADALHPRQGEGEQIEAERRRLMEIVKRQQADLAIVTEADEGLGLEVIAGQGAAAPKAPPAAPAQPQGPSTAATIPAEGEVAAAGSAAGRRRKKAAAGGSRAADPHQAAAVAVKKSSRRKKAVDIPGPEASGAPRGGADTKPSAAPQREDPIHGKCGEGRSGKSHAVSLAVVLPDF